MGSKHVERVESSQGLESDKFPSFPSQWEECRYYVSPGVRSLLQFSFTALVLHLVVQSVVRHAIGVIGEIGEDKQCGKRYSVRRRVGGKTSIPDSCDVLFLLGCGAVAGQGGRTARDRRRLPGAVQSVCGWERMNKCKKGRTPGRRHWMTSASPKSVVKFKYAPKSILRKFNQTCFNAFSSPPRC